MLKFRFKIFQIKDKKYRLLSEGRELDNQDFRIREQKTRNKKNSQLEIKKGQLTFKKLTKKPLTLKL